MIPFDFQHLVHQNAGNFGPKLVRTY